MAYLFVGFVIGVIAGILARTWWQEHLDAERAPSHTFYRHNLTGERYEELCRAAPPESPMDRHFVLIHSIEIYGQHEYRREIWREADVEANFTKTDKLFSN